MSDHDHATTMDLARAHDPEYRKGEAIAELHRGIRAELHHIVESFRPTNLDVIQLTHVLTYPKHFDGLRGVNGAEMARAAQRSIERMIASPLPGETWALTGKSYLESAAGLFRECAEKLEKER